MKDYIVKYEFQGTFDTEPSHSVAVIKAESEEDARSMVEWENRLIHASVRETTPCTEIDYVVDLCEGCKTVATFVVKGLFPEDPSKAQGDGYLVSLGTARTKAYEIISRDFPDFSGRLNTILSHKCQYHPTDSMVIVRPSHWIENGKKAYLVTVFYRRDDGELHSEKDCSSFSFDILAKDPEEARRIGIEKAGSRVIGTIQSVLVMRTAEKPNNRAGI